VNSGREWEETLRYHRSSEKEDTVEWKQAITVSLPSHASRFFRANIYQVKNNY